MNTAPKGAAKRLIISLLAMAALSGCAVYGPPPPGYGAYPATHYGQSYYGQGYYREDPYYGGQAVYGPPAYYGPEVGIGIGFGFGGGRHGHHHR